MAKISEVKSEEKKEIKHQESSNQNVISLKEATRQINSFYNRRPIKTNADLLKISKFWQAQLTKTTEELLQSSKIIEGKINESFDIMKKVLREKLIGIDETEVRKILQPYNKAPFEDQITNLVKDLNRNNLSDLDKLTLRNTIKDLFALKNEEIENIRQGHGRVKKQAALDIKEKIYSKYSDKIKSIHTVHFMALALEEYRKEKNVEGPIFIPSAFHSSRPVEGIFRNNLLTYGNPMIFIGEDLRLDTHYKANNLMLDTIDYTALLINSDDKQLIIDNLKKFPGNKEDEFQCLPGTDQRLIPVISDLKKKDVPEETVKLVNASQALVEKYQLYIISRKYIGVSNESHIMPAIKTILNISNTDPHALDVSSLIKSSTAWHIIYYHPIFLGQYYNQAIDKAAEEIIKQSKKRIKDGTENWWMVAQESLENLGIKNPGPKLLNDDHNWKNNAESLAKDLVEHKKITIERSFQKELPKSLLSKDAPEKIANLIVSDDLEKRNIGLQAMRITCEVGTYGMRRESSPLQLARILHVTGRKLNEIRASDDRFLFSYNSISKAKKFLKNLSQEEEPIATNAQKILTTLDLIIGKNKAAYLKYKNILLGTPECMTLRELIDTMTPPYIIEELEAYTKNTSDKFLDKSEIDFITSKQIKAGNTEYSILCLKLGANIRYINYEGDNLIHMAAYRSLDRRVNKNKAEIIKYIRDNHTEIYQELIKQRNTSLNMPLNIAASSGAKLVFDMLVDYSQDAKSFYPIFIDSLLGGNKEIYTEIYNTKIAPLSAQQRQDLEQECCLTTRIIQNYRFLNIENLKFIIDKNIWVGQKGPEGKNILHLIAASDSNRGKLVCDVFKYVHNNNPALFKSLMEQYDLSLRTPLAYLVYYPFKIFKNLYDKNIIGLEPTSILDKNIIHELAQRYDYDTPLHLHQKYNFLNSFYLENPNLLRGIINKKSFESRSSPVNIGLQSQNEQFIKFLINNDIYVDETLIDYSLIERNKDGYANIANYNNGEYRIVLAIFENKLNSFKFLSILGAKLDIVRINQDNILHCATTSRRHNILEHIRDNEQQIYTKLISARDKFARKPIYYAIVNDDIDSFELLKDDLEDINLLHDNPLHIAMQTNSFNIICHIKEQYGQLFDEWKNRKNSDNQTPITKTIHKNLSMDSLYTFKTLDPDNFKNNSFSIIVESYKYCRSNLLDQMIRDYPKTIKQLGESGQNLIHVLTKFYSSPEFDPKNNSYRQNFYKLVNAGMDLFALNKQGRNFLHHIINLKYPILEGSLNFLLDNISEYQLKCLANQKDNQGNTAIIDLPKNYFIKKENTLQKLYKHADISIISSKGQNILHIIASAHYNFLHIDAVKDLLSTKEYKRLKLQEDMEGCTPMFIAGLRVNHDLFTYLNIGKSKDSLRKINSRGKTLFHIAVEKGNKRLFEYLRQNKCANINLSIFEELCNKPDHEGNTPILLTAVFKQLDVFKCLFENHGHSISRVNILAVNKHGDNILHLARKYNSDGIYLHIKKKYPDIYGNLSKKLNKDNFVPSQLLPISEESKEQKDNGKRKPEYIQHDILRRRKKLPSSSSSSSSSLSSTNFNMEIEYEYENKGEEQRPVKKHKPATEITDATHNTAALRNQASKDRGSTDSRRPNH